MLTPLHPGDDGRTSAPGVPRSEEAERLRRRLESLPKPCGCKSGAALTLLALIGWPIRMILGDMPGTALGIAAWLGTYPLAVLGAALVGKVAGIGVGRAQRRWLRFLLKRQTSAFEAAGRI